MYKYLAAGQRLSEFLWVNNDIVSVYFSQPANHWAQELRIKVSDTAQPVIISLSHVFFIIVLFLLPK